MEAFIAFAVTLGAIGWLALSVWFVVIAVRFLRSGRKAFDRYVALTTAPHQGPLQAPPPLVVDAPVPAPPAVKW